MEIKYYEQKSKVLRVKDRQITRLEINEEEGTIIRTVVHSNLKILQNKYNFKEKGIEMGLMIVTSGLREVETSVPLKVIKALEEFDNSYIDKFYVYFKDKEAHTFHIYKEEDGFFKYSMFHSSKGYGTLVQDKEATEHFKTQLEMCPIVSNYMMNSATEKDIRDTEAKWE